MNKPFNIIRLYNNLDDKKDELKKLRLKYNKLMHEYKNLIVEYAKFRTQTKSHFHKG